MRFELKKIKNCWTTYLLECMVELGIHALNFIIEVVENIVLVGIRVICFSKADETMHLVPHSKFILVKTKSPNTFNA